jgi:hypothetical protein
VDIVIELCLVILMYMCLDNHVYPHAPNEFVKCFRFHSYNSSMF